MFAQKNIYKPLVNPGAVWFETYADWPPGPWGYNAAGKNYLQGDTTINSLQYLKIYRVMLDVYCQETIIYGPIYAGAIREDITQQKAWYIQNDFTTEILFFDFSLGIGDTVPEQCYFSQEYYPIVVTDIDTIATADGKERRLWKFNNSTGGDQSFVIEGVGNINGLLSPFCYWFEAWPMLFCHQIDNTLIYPLQSYCVLPSDTCATVGIEEKSTTKNILAYPNPLPINHLLYLTIPDCCIGEMNTISMFNIFGKQIGFWQLPGNNLEIKLPTLKMGLYILRVTNKQNQYNIKIKIY
jgi:hypothetical protein